MCSLTFDNYVETLARVNNGMSNKDILACFGKGRHNAVLRDAAEVICRFDPARLSDDGWSRLCEMVKAFCIQWKSRRSATKVEDFKTGIIAAFCKSRREREGGIAATIEKYVNAFFSDHCVEIAAVVDSHTLASHVCSIPHQTAWYCGDDLDSIPD